MFFLCAHNHVKLQKWRHRKTQRLRRQSASGETLMLMRVVVSAAEGERKHLYSCLVLLHLSFLIFCEGFGFGAPQGPPPPAGDWPCSSWSLFAFSRFRLLLPSSCAAARFSIFDRQSFRFSHHGLHSWPTPSTGLGATFAGTTLDVHVSAQWGTFGPRKWENRKGNMKIWGGGHTERAFIILRDDKRINHAGKHFGETFVVFWGGIMIHREKMTDG